MSVPSISMEPDVGAMKPATMRRVVVLPEPDGPSSVRNSRAAPRDPVVDGDRPEILAQIVGTRAGRSEAKPHVSAVVACRRTNTSRRRSVVVTTRSVVDTAATVGSTTWRTCSHISTGGGIVPRS